jgi:hypothetical protein
MSVASSNDETRANAHRADPTRIRSFSRGDTMKTAITAATTFALAIATANLVAQSAGTPQAPAPPATPNPSASNPARATTPPGTMAPPNAAQPPGTMTAPPSGTMTAPPSGTMTTPPAPPAGVQGALTRPNFSTLDRNGLGYVTQRDAAGNVWLQQNFSTCDTDHNGQVSSAEYSACSARP